MGVVLKDQNILYASENIGKLDIIIDPTQPQSVIVTGDATLPAIANSTIQLTATVLPSTAIDKSVTWSSSDTNIATVNSSGLVTRVAALTSDYGQSYTVTITARASNGISASVVISAAVLTLPSDAFAIFDGIVGARNSTSALWKDTSGNGRNMTIVDGNANPNYWDATNNPDCLVCDCNNHSTSGKIESTTFSPTTGYTVLALIDYDESATNFHHGDYSTGNVLDVIFAAIVHRDDGTNNYPRAQVGIGQRRSAEANKPFITSYDGTNFGRHYVNTAADLSGVKLLAWSVDGNTCNIYVNGDLHQAIQYEDLVIGETPYLYFFATNLITGTVNNTVNYFGKVYGVAVYGRALSASDITQAKNYYLERYSDYYYIEEQ